MDDQPHVQASDVNPPSQRKNTSLTTLARAKFGTLSAAENLLLKEVPNGNVADCSKLDDKGGDPENADKWGSARQIRPEIVGWLCMDEDARKLVYTRGIRVYGANIKGPLGLSFATIPFLLMFQHCRFSDDIDLSRSEISEVDLEGSLVAGIMADALIVTNDVFLSRGFTSRIGVNLYRARIGGDLDCATGVFTNRDGIALNAEGINVQGDVWFGDGFRASGEVRLSGALIGGNLDCTAGTFEDESSYALYADGINVKGSVFLSGDRNEQQALPFNQARAQRE